MVLLVSPLTVAAAPRDALPSRPTVSPPGTVRDSDRVGARGREGSGFLFVFSNEGQRLPSRTRAPVAQVVAAEGCPSLLEEWRQNMSHRVDL